MLPIDLNADSVKFHKMLLIENFVLNRQKSIKQLSKTVSCY